MLNADEARELRALHARAYGPGGGLTEADAVRMRALEEARVDSRETPSRPFDAAQGVEPDRVEPAAESDPVHDSPAAPGDDQGEPVSAAASDPADVGRREPSADASGTGGLRSAVRTHWKVVAVASVALLVVGLGAGWALFGSRDDGVALTDAQQERRVELQTDGGYDQGSVRAIGTDEDAIVWFGTRKEGELECIVLDVGDQSNDMCQQADDLLSQGYGAGVTVASSGDGEGSDGEPMEVSATAVRSASGEIVAIIQRWPSMRTGWLAQFPADERERAEELLALGFEDYSFSVVGYVNDLPIWRGTRVDDGIAQECLIVDAVEATQCADAWKVQSGDEAVSLGGVVVDESDGSSASWSIDLQVTTSGSAYLTITGDVPAVPGSTTGAVVEVGGENGDPISVEAPSDPAG